MTTAYIILALFGIVALTLDRKRGLYFVIMAGFLQDPIRKLSEGAPIVLTLLSTAALFAVYIRNKTRRGRGISLLALYPQLRQPMGLFVFVITAQALNAYINTSSFTVAAIGLIAYLSPIPAIVLSYEFAGSFEDMRKILSFYIALTVLFMASLWLEWYGVDWEILGTFGKEWLVFYGEMSMKMLSGLFRSPEIAAWHGAVAAIFAIMFSFGKGRRLDKKNLLIFVVCFFTLFLTGRRKGIGTLLIFGGIYTLYLFWFKISGKRRFAMLLLTVAILFFGTYFVSEVTQDSTRTLPLSPYFLRGQSTLQDSPDRLNTVLGNIKYTWREAGILGMGAGYFSQGSQAVLISDEKTAKYTEVGAAKIMGELGLPGVMVLLWVGRVWYKVMRKKLTAVLSQEGRRYAALLFSLLLANMTAFFFSALVFGDPFVLTMMGMMTGMLMAVPKIEVYPPGSQKTSARDIKGYAQRKR